MVINYKNNSKIKILLDIKDLENNNINLQEWLVSPKKSFYKIFQNFLLEKNIDIKRLKAGLISILSNL